jgi:peptidoglycan/LPS O-acetylase OafA/YrhL
MPAKPTQARILELDGLRGFALLFVLIGHYLESAPPYGALGAIARPFRMGWSGVDLFFVLSGFLIGGILLDARESSSYFRTFYLRRFFRIVPLYYVWICAYILIALVAGPFVSRHAQGAQMQTADLAVLGHFLFLQNFYNPLGGAVTDFWFGALWSLAVEEQFYLVSPLLIRLLTNGRLRQLLIAVIVSAPLIRMLVRAIAGADSWLPYRLTLCRADALAWGILLAMLWRSEKARAWLAANSKQLYKPFVALLAGMVVLSARFWGPKYLLTESIGYSWIAAFYGVVLLLVLLRPQSTVAKIARLGWLREVGRVSYCMYIIHFAVFRICVIALLHKTMTMENRVDFAVAVFAGFLTYALACLSWWLFENPLLKIGHRFKYATASGALPEIAVAAPAASE